MMGTSSSFGTRGESETGSISIFAMDTPPKGYLVCNGAAISRSTYSKLFAMIGTFHGTGDGSTTFNLPDLRDRFLSGSSGSRTVGSFQAQSTQEHKHATAFGADPGTFYMRLSGFTSEVIAVQRAFLGTSGNEVSAVRVYDTGTTKALTGETRPNNVALLFCIKY